MHRVTHAVLTVVLLVGMIAVPPSAETVHAPAESEIAPVASAQSGDITNTTENINYTIPAGHTVGTIAYVNGNLELFTNDGTTFTAEEVEFPSGNVVNTRGSAFSNARSAGFNGTKYWIDGFDGSTNQMSQFDSDFNQETQITTDSYSSVTFDGTFWYIAKLDGTIEKYDTDGNLVDSATLSATGEIEGLAAVDGELWAIDQDSGGEDFLKEVDKSTLLFTGESFSLGDASNREPEYGMVELDGDIYVQFASASTASDSRIFRYTVGAAPAVSTSLELEIDSWMPRDDSQPYRVYLNETNTTTGVTNMTEVTAGANVTIYNITNTTGFSEPIATVNNTTNTIKSYNQTGVVAVNATYNGNELANASNLTVGPRNLSNIGIMPPEQWPCSFLGCDEAPGGGDNPHNIGSSMQWLWLIIVIMVAATRFAENPFVGVGTGIVFSILVWVLEYIDLGAVLITVFSGLLIGALMARTQMGRGVTRDNEEAARISARGKDQP